jgi:hypothetical protein
MNSSEIMNSVKKTLNRIYDTGDIGKDLSMLLIIFLVGIGSFGLGRISAHEEARNNELSISDNKEGITGSSFQEPVTSSGSDVQNGMYVGSRSGASYHLPWCPGAQRIKDENKIWFKTKEEAVLRGYSPAANCKGI